MAEIRFAPPEADAPGFLSRSRKAMVFRERMAASGSGMTVEKLDEMVDFLATWVSEPSDPQQAREALLEASENQFYQLLDIVSGESKKKLSPQTKPRPSGSTRRASR